MGYIPFILPPKAPSVKKIDYGKPGASLAYTRIEKG